MKGFYSFSLILAMVMLLLMLASLGTHSLGYLEGIENDIIKLEQASKERTILENNVDKIIRIKLEEQIDLENFNVLLIQTEINLSLLNYLQRRAKMTDLFFENEKEITLINLNLNSTAFLLQAKGKSYAEYSYNSNPLKQELVSQKFGDETVLYFMIPIGYTKRIIK